MAGCSSRLLGLCQTLVRTPSRLQPIRKLCVLQQCRPISSVLLDHHSSPAPSQCSSITYPYLLNNSCIVQYRNIYSSVPNYSEDQKKDEEKSVDTSSPKTEEKLSVFQRFKKTYKEHGKVLIGVHLLTSSVWFGTFFYAAKVGVDIIPLLEWMNFSEKIISTYRDSSLGDIALAYLMYKLATPARYTVTLAGTNFAIKYLRKIGRMEQKSESSSLRTLARDSGKELRDKQKKMKGKASGFEDKMKSKVKDEVKEFKERRAHVKATFTKFQSKLRDKAKNKKNGKSSRK